MTHLSLHLKYRELNSCNSQRSRESGAATLVTAIVLMIAATILAFLSAQIVLDETQVTSNDFRTSQATEAALASIDAGLAFFNNNGTQIDTASVEPTAIQLTNLENSCSFTAGATSATELTSTNGLYYFANNSSTDSDRCGANGATNTGTLFGMGWSDDCSAKRTISVCLGVVPLFGEGEGPKQPFITKAAVGVSGNASIVNRYTNITVWAGDDADISGNAYDTYLRPSGTSIEDYTEDQLIDEDPANNAQEVSNQTSGFGLDMVLGDPTLRNTSEEEFWATFFGDTKRETLKNALNDVGRSLASGTTPPANDTDAGTETTGQYWIDGDTAFNGNNIYGSPDNPVVVIVDGDLRIGGSPKIYGLVYVTGELNITGTMTVVGSMISENGPNTGNGTMQVVYKPFTGDGDSDPSVSNSGVVIPGSWRDW
ncbi:MAG: hypothetical protein HWE12_06430 [Oceanospirillaceae bacterium]|nr:hypothetical protein [Oceanospirillaceae bacterium]